MRVHVKVCLGGGPIGTQPVLPGVYEAPFPPLLENEITFMQKAEITSSPLVDLLDIEPAENATEAASEQSDAPVQPVRRAKA